MRKAYERFTLEDDIASEGSCDVRACTLAVYLAAIVHWNLSVNHLLEELSRQSYERKHRIHPLREMAEMMRKTPE